VNIEDSQSDLNAKDMSNNGHTSHDSLSDGEIKVLIIGKNEFKIK
jgi:hypothetical protein